MAKAAAATKYETERDALIDAIRSGEGAQWEQGLRWRNLHQGHLWREAGYHNGMEFIEGELWPRGLAVPSPATLAHWGDVAVHFTQDVALRVGMTRLVLALQNWRHLGKTDFSREHPGDEPMTIPIAGGAKITKALQACTEAELRAANRSFADSQHPSLSPQEVALEKLGQTALEKVLGDTGTASFRLARKKEDLFLHLQVTMPFSKLAALARALSKAF